MPIRGICPRSAKKADGMRTNEKTIKKLCFSACCGAVKLHNPRLADLVRQNPSFTMSKSIQCTDKSAQGNCLLAVRANPGVVIMASWQKWMVETDGIEPTT
jgi:ApbE superfamily uncharacterized protein (UPF0280 family)